MTSDAASLSALPYDETSRLAALHALALLDSAPEKEFDALVALAAELLGCPTALITLIDRNRLWIKASTTPGERELDRDIAFCDSTIRQGEPMIVDDLSHDARFRDNPLVAAGARFYAGTAIHVADGEGVRQPVGTLCVLDDRPRSLNSAGHAALQHLASLAEALIAARRTALEAIRIATAGERLVSQLANNDRIFRQAERIAMIGSWRLSVADQTLEWSDNVYRIHGLEVGAMPALSEALDFYPPQARADVSARLTRTIDTGEPFDFEADLVTADGRRRRIRAACETESRDGVVQALIGVFQDITDRHGLETQLRRSADTDALTGIANRAAFDRELETAMGTARDKGSPLMLALIDLDGFKTINDSLGHDAGDDVLRLTGTALTQPWLRDCFAARIGGDEFALIVTDPQMIAQADQLAVDIEAALRVSVEANGITMTSAGSVGMANFDDEIHSLRDFARRADVMLYAAKRARVGRRPGPSRKAA
ncbi:diguanylate cyclase (GGDEF)-like protein [Sphingomonas insulae]|uniref:Diguanylate cyclase n=1 Tax=Sphingomonas insulae TaxID=424800 RepID=A0ABN1HWH4_9SPHN|nr:diguanylate cyclase [Sphingomonas insulae]NIJ28740.1 diguanylate cyclase (GGDEF)-like protein [Sphingomonas insulae]